MVEHKYIPDANATDSQSSAPAIERPNPPSDTAETSGPETVRCRSRSCGWEGDPSEAGKGSCPKCGCFLPTNTVALIHGGRSLAARSGTALDPAEYVAIRDAVLDDLGGEAEVSTAMYELVCLFAAACVLCKVMWRHIEATGPLTKVGRKRACVDLYLAASTRADRLAKQIGTDRRAVRATLAEVMADE